MLPTYACTAAGTTLLVSLFISHLIAVSIATKCIYARTLSSLGITFTAASRVCRPHNTHARRRALCFLLRITHAMLRFHLFLFSLLSGCCHDISLLYPRSCVLARDAASTPDLSYRGMTRESLVGSSSRHSCISRHLILCRATPRCSIALPSNIFGHRLQPYHLLPLDHRPLTLPSPSLFLYHPHPHSACAVHPADVSHSLPWPPA